MLEAIIFDVDGTLSNTERDGHLIAFNQTFADAGLDWYWSDELYAELLAVSGGKERIRYYLESYNTRFTLPDDLNDLDALVADLHASKTRLYEQLLSQGGIPLRTGVERLLTEALDSGMRMAIATTTSLSNVEALLRNTCGEESIGWFEVIGAGDMVAAKKPAPDIYTMVMNEMGLAPNQCLVLEDSENGLRSALSAGISSVLVTTNHFTRDHDFTGATLVIDHLGEPDRPFTRLQGRQTDASYVNLELLKSLHEASNS